MAAPDKLPTLKVPSYKAGFYEVAMRRGCRSFLQDLLSSQPDRPVTRREAEKAWVTTLEAKYHEWATPKRSENWRLTKLELTIARMHSDKGIENLWIEQEQKFKARGIYLDVTSIGSTSTIMFNAINRPDTTYVSPIVGRDFKDNMEKQALFEEKDTRQIARIALAKYEYGDDYVSGMEGESGDEVEDGDGELLRASNGWEGVHGAYRPTESDEAAEDEREAACWDSLGLDEDSCLDEDERAGDSTDDSDSDEDDDSDVIYIGGYKKPDFSKLDAIDYKLYKLNGRSSAGASKWTREDVDDDEVVVPGMDEDDSEWDEYDCDEWGYLCGNHLGLNRFAKGVRLDTVEERQRYEDELENYDGEDEEDNDEQEWPEASVENVEGLYSTHTITDSQSMHDIDGGKQGEDDNPSTANLPRRAAPLKQSGPNVKRGREEDVEGDMENGVENEQECAIKKRKLDMPLPIREKVLFEDEL